MKKASIIALTLILVACGVGVALALGYYPIASVNGHLVMAHDFRTELGAARNYAKSAQTAYQSLPTSSLQLAATSDTDLARIVLDTVVENSLVHHAVPQIVGNGAEKIVNDKVDQFAPQGELASAANTLFKLSPADFRTYILVPQAEREVLGSKLFLSGNTLANWTADARKSARVRIFSTQYAWNGSEVVTR
jgi:hypothetical protein